MIHWTPNLEKYKEYIENPNYKLEGWWIIERFLSIPKPNCCEEIKNYPSVFLDAQRELFYEGAIESVFWSTFTKNNYFSFQNLNLFLVHFGIIKSEERQLCENYIKNTPNLKYCPFCGKKLPKIIKKTPEEINYPIAEWSDGNYCSTCQKRICNCKCYPELSAWKCEKNEDNL
jgi:hypothetical protein